jgi:hypothetical protein
MSDTVPFMRPVHLGDAPYWLVAQMVLFRATYSIGIGKVRINCVPEVVCHSQLACIWPASIGMIFRPRPLRAAGGLAGSVSVAGIPTPLSAITSLARPASNGSSTSESVPCPVGKACLRLLVTNSLTIKPSGPTDLKTIQGSNLLEDSRHVKTGRKMRLFWLMIAVALTSCEVHVAGARKGEVTPPANSFDRGQQSGASNQ